MPKTKNADTKSAQKKSDTKSAQKKKGKVEATAEALALELAKAKANEAHEVILAKALEVGASTAEAEFVLLADFAQAFDNGEMSVRGYSATLKALEEKGFSLGSFKKSDGQNIQIMGDLAKLPEAPRNARKIASTGDALRKKYGVEKTRETLAKALEAGKTYSEIKVPKVEANARPNGHAKNVKLNAETVNALAELITKRTQDGKPAEPKLAEALEDLGVAIEALLLVEAEEIEE